MTTLTHGYTGTRTFKSWESMKQRCFNTKSKDYARYGARGITVCVQWRHSFETFLRDMGERPVGRTLDRIDSNGNYEKSNCRWATPTEQQRNTRVSRQLTINGVSKPLIVWAVEASIPYDLLLRRANKGLSQEKLFAPSRSKKVSRFQGVLVA